MIHENDAHWQLLNSPNSKNCGLADFSEIGFLHSDTKLSEFCWQFCFLTNDQTCVTIYMNSPSCQIEPVNNQKIGRVRRVLLNRLSYLCSICLLQQQPALWCCLHNSECSSSPYSHVACILCFHHCHVQFCFKACDISIAPFSQTFHPTDHPLSCKWVTLQREGPCKSFMHINMSVLHSGRALTQLFLKIRPSSPAHRTTVEKPLLLLHAQHCTASASQCLFSCMFGCSGPRSEDPVSSLHTGLCSRMKPTLVLS